MTEPLEIHKIGSKSEQRDRAGAKLRQVGLNEDMLMRFPRVFWWPAPAPVDRPRADAGAVFAGL